MSDRVRVGVRIDGSVWERFRQNVHDRKGQTRGVLGDELENAIREYIRDDTSPAERRIEKRLERIETAVGAAATDGGDAPEDAGEHTHTPSRLDVAEKPAANAATDKKVAYLAEQLREEHNGEFEEIARSVIVETVKSEYSFRSDTAKRYVERLIDYFGMVEHPVADGIYVTEDRHEQLLAERRERVREEAPEV